MKVINLIEDLLRLEKVFNDMSQNLLEVKDLKTYFFISEGVVKAADGISFTIKPQESFGLVGETGCGKSVTGRSIMRLIVPPGKTIGGEVIYKGENLLELPKEEMEKINGDEIAMIFQDPMTSLNPTIKVGYQVAEALLIHQDIDPDEAMAKSIEVLSTVGIPYAERRAFDYPHQFSGGMRQRVLIAIALACNPSLLIADEPTTALDVTIQAQILELIKRLKENFGTSLMLITHDLGVIAETCSRMAVMYAGKTAEIGETEKLFEDPVHPYTRGLMGSIPGLDEVSKKRLKPIEGSVPDMIRLPSGCYFSPRCPFKEPICEKVSPPSIDIDGKGHVVACHVFAGSEK